jgi:hypothetical protein
MRPDLNHFAKPPRPPGVGDIGQQLRNLPAMPAPYDWAEFRRRSHERAMPKRQIITWPHAAAAAGLTAFVAAMAMLGTSDQSQVDWHDGRAPVVASTVAPPDSAEPATAGSMDPADPAKEAREWLAQHPAEPAVVRAGPRLVVSNLEDRIAWFDDALTDERLRGATPAQLNVLQTERARLVSSLAQVRYAEVLVADGS